MKVGKYYFSWQHHEDSTSCFCYLDPPRGSLKNIPPLVTGISKLNPKDHYDNAVGRKISLLHTLQLLSEKKLLDGSWTKIESDTFHEEAWEIYRAGMTKEPRWEKQTKN